MEKYDYVKELFDDLTRQIDYEFENRALTKNQRKTLIKMLIMYLLLTNGE